MRVIQGFAVALLIGALAVLFIYLARSRMRVVRYHDLPTTRVNQASHGGGPA